MSVAQRLTHSPEPLDHGPRAFNIAEVGRRLGVSRDLVYREIASGRLRSVRIGNRHVISANALAEFLGDGPPSATVSTIGGERHLPARGNG